MLKKYFKRGNNFYYAVTLLDPRLKANKLMECRLKE